MRRQQAGWTAGCITDATAWSGCKLHLPETCDEAMPHLIADVQTTPAAATDDGVTGKIHTLAERGLQPFPHPSMCGMQMQRRPSHKQYGRTPRRTHYFDQLNTHLAHLSIAAAMNVVRLLRRPAGEAKSPARSSRSSTAPPLGEAKANSPLISKLGRTSFASASTRSHRSGGLIPNRLQSHGKLQRGSQPSLVDGGRLSIRGMQIGISRAWRPSA